MQLLSAGATIFLKGFIFFAHENMKNCPKKPKSSILYGLNLFQNCQPSQNQPKSLFHKKLLAAQLMYNDFDIPKPGF